MREAVERLGLQPDFERQFDDPLLKRTAARDMIVDKRLGDDVAHAKARVQRRIGILKDHLQAAAIGRSWRRDRWSIRSPQRRISPAVGSINLRIALPAVDLPQPDSPTSPRVSPAAMSKEMPSTARTWPTTCRKIPPRTGKCLTRPLTDNKGAAALIGRAGRNGSRRQNGRAPFLRSPAFRAGKER